MSAEVGLDLIETYVPVINNNSFMGALEVYVNVTDQMNRVRELFWQSYLLSVPILLFFVFLVIFTSLKIGSYNQERNKMLGELQSALDEINILRGTLPICASCKKIRDDEGYWHQVEKYISKHSDAQFSHGICQDCIEKLYPTLSKTGDNKDNSKKTE